VVQQRLQGVSAGRLQGCASRDVILTVGLRWYMMVIGKFKSRDVLYGERISDGMRALRLR